MGKRKRNHTIFNRMCKVKIGADGLTLHTLRRAELGLSAFTSYPLRMLFSTLECAFPWACIWVCEL